MKNSKNKRTIILAAILVILLIVAYKTVFTSPSPDSTGVATATPNMSGAVGMIDVTPSSSGSDAESILNEIESINFDTSIMQDQNFKSLKSIEKPLVSLPIGRKNPFSDVSSSK